MTRHWYEGSLVTIKTASGNELSVTPNHPILTRSGWISASTLKEGDGVISGDGFKRPHVHNLNVEHIKATAQQMYDALSVVGMVVGVASVAVNFHGERPHGNVDV